MGIEFIEEIRNKFDKWRLKRMPDEKIVEMISKMNTEELERKIPTMMESINQPEQIVKALNETAPALPDEEVNRIIEKLPRKETIQAIKDPTIRENLPLDTMIRLIPKTTVINTMLEELYRRAGFQNDDTITYFISQAEKNPNISERGKEIIKRIIAKQIATKYARFNNIMHIENFLKVYPVQESENEKLDLVDLVERESPKVVKKLNTKYKKALEQYEKSKNNQYKEKPAEPHVFTSETKRDLESKIKKVLEKNVENKNQEDELIHD